ncbi:MAG: PhzF family phenazine biosynthesis protein [Betaproteobacteria bacterium]
MKERRFAQIDVFTATPYYGNPLAVVLDGDGLDETEMRRFARWTNLSETTFLLPPTQPGADYRVRIFTPARELPFAGHPTLGSCHAWLAAGGKPHSADTVVQECAAGLVRISRDGARLAFAAPPLVRTGPADEPTLTRVAAALGIDRAEVVHHQWVDNGPGWVAVMLPSVERVLALRPDSARLGDLKVGVIGPHPAGAECAFEVRAFINFNGSLVEDPVTGSLNAGLAQWLIGAGRAPPSYVAAQGAALGRAGRVHVARDGADVWIGGDSVTCVQGRVAL